VIRLHEHSEGRVSCPIEPQPSGCAAQPPLGGSVSISDSHDTPNQDLFTSLDVQYTCLLQP